MGRPRQSIEITASAEELYERYRRERDVVKRRRYQFAYEIKRGTSTTAAAQACGVSKATASNWIV